MVIFILILLGLALGSFVNALVYRLHIQITRRAKPRDKKYSIVHGRSMCPACKHVLAWYDLIPVLSWLALRGKCRYCRKPIPDSPLVELSVPALFVFSYIFWPFELANTLGWVNFGVWLVMCTGFVALIVSDLRYMTLPNRIIFPLAVVAKLNATLQIAASSGDYGLMPTLYSVAVGFGVFYLLFQISDGKWIGGGDVKLGLVFGLLLADPLKSAGVIFLASLLGTIIVLPMLAIGRLSTGSRIPFGPFLIIATIVMMLFGDSLIAGLKETMLVV